MTSRQVMSATFPSAQTDQPAGGQQHGDGEGDLQKDERGVHWGDAEV